MDLREAAVVLTGFVATVVATVWVAGPNPLVWIPFLAGGVVVLAVASVTAGGVMDMASGRRPSPHGSLAMAGILMGMGASGMGAWKLGVPGHLALQVGTGYALAAAGVAGVALDHLRGRMARRTRARG